MILKMLPALLVLAAAPVSAQGSATTATPSTPSAMDKAAKKVCRRQVDTGTIMPRRVCHTGAEWSSIDAQNERNAEIYRNRAASRAGTSSAD